MTTETSKSTTLIDRLFAAGAHLGFSKSRRHPSIAKYVFTHKEGTDIFDLEQTAPLIEAAQAVMAEAGSKGKTVLLVGTKEEAAQYVKSAAEAAEMPYVTNRWIGGMLTNFSEIKKRIDRMQVLIAERVSGESERKYIKKERVVIGREIAKLEFNFGGIAKMDRLPDLMLVVDPRHDVIAVTEARDKNIPVIAIMSSDCDASLITHPVLVNDAHRASITMAINELMSAYSAARATYTPPEPRAAVRTDRTRRPAAPRQTSARS